MTPKLSPLTAQLVEKLFAPGDQAEAARLLSDECGNNLPFCKDYDETKMERIRFAALRVSIGTLEDLHRAVDLAKRDWRDLLVWARFAESLSAHQEWAGHALKESLNPMVIILIGLSGSGKTTVGNLLARELGWMFYEGDGFHSTENFTRFYKGQPIPEEAVEIWLAKVRELIGKNVAKKQSAILACTALKESAREKLCICDEVRFVYLQGTATLLEERQKKRKAQLSNLERLAYQSANFEEPKTALNMDISNPPQQIVESIRAKLNI